MWLCSLRARHTVYMSESTNETFSPTITANAQSDVQIFCNSTMSPCNETDKLSIDDMVEIIKSKDLQIAKLQSTIDQQSLQIQQQTAAIENMQKQMTELSSSLASLVKQSDKPPTKKIAPIFTISKSNTPKPVKKGNNKKCKTTTSSSAASTSQNMRPSLIQPNSKRPRHLMEEEQGNNSNDSAAVFDSNDTSNMNINTGQSNINISMDASNNVYSVDNNSTQNVNDLNDEWNDYSVGEGDNFVNFKKNAINKEKNITPIEISIKNNEKGSLHALLIEHFGNNSFLWSNASKRSIRINPFTQKMKDAMIQWLKNRKYPFHTFLNKENKPNTFIIRGLPDSISQSHIGNALQQAGIQYNSIERHSTGYTRSHQLLSDLWRVATPSSITIQHFKAIDGILNVKIRVEVLKRSPVLQCKNCQLFFHSAAGCYRKFRCVKCDKDHAPGDCPRNSNKSLPVVCCNCHKNHSANDLQHCPFFAKYIKPIIDKRVKERNQTAIINNKSNGVESIPRNPPRNNFPTTVQPNVSFSNVVAKNFSSKQKPDAKLDNQATSNTGNLSTTDLKNLLLQNMQLMSAHQELLKKLSCLIE